MRVGAGRRNQTWDELTCKSGCLHAGSCILHHHAILGINPKLHGASLFISHIFYSLKSPLMGKVAEPGHRGIGGNTNIRASSWHLAMPHDTLISGPQDRDLRLHVRDSWGAPALQQPGRCRVQASAAQRGQQRQWRQSPSQHRSQPEQDWRRPACQLTGEPAYVGPAALQAECTRYTTVHSGQHSAAGDAVCSRETDDGMMGCRRGQHLYSVCAGSDCNTEACLPACLHQFNRPCTAWLLWGRAPSLGLRYAVV